MKHNPLIIALDTSSSRKALNLVRKLKVTGVAFKVGFELFSSQGPRIVNRILGHNVRVFLDLKFHDIPNTVAHAATVATKMGVWMFNVHASGGVEMMSRAKEASQEAAYKKKIDPPLIVGVTVLTSLESLHEINIPLSPAKQALHLAGLVKEAGLDGVVCSGQEAKSISQKCGSGFILVTPGIRLPSDASDDQKRTLTPKEALVEGSHYLVIGRPITQAASPLRAVHKILSSLS